jgi:pimeloyl-ACP methyl ester carboxylesterase
VATVDAVAALSHHRIPAAGVDLHVVFAGPPEGPPLVLLHGWPDSWRCWERVVPLLAGEYRLIVPDQRGFGESGMPEGTSSYAMPLLAADVLALLDHIGIERAGLVGHDFGGAIAWSLGAFAPGRFTRAVVLAAPHPLRLREIAAEDRRQLAASFYVWLMHAGPAGEALLAAGGFRRLAEWAFGGSRVPADVIEAHVASWSEPGRFHAMAEWYRANFRPELFNPDVPLQLPPVAIPVRYLHAESDAAFVEGAATGSGPFVDAEFDEAVVPGTTHWIPYDAPEAVAAAVRDWMNRGA